MRDPEEWVSLLQQGDEEAWKDFIREFSRFVPIVSRRLGLSASDGREVLQEMTVMALRSIHNLRDPSRLASWTYTIAHRCAINLWKERARHGAGEREPDELWTRLPSAAPAPDDLLVRMEESRQVRQAVALLGERCRELLDDLFLRENRLSYREIAEKRRLPIGSIGPTLARCLERLRPVLRSVSKDGHSKTAMVEEERPE